ncbi:TPA: hypothetical protein ACH3X1_007064 [Trebouxia sp. C0004]
MWPGHMTRVLNRMCLPGQLQLLALSSVQLSSSHHIAFAAVPWASAINFVVTVDIICSALMCTDSLARTAVFYLLNQVVLLLAIARPYCMCHAGDPQWHDIRDLVNCMWMKMPLVLMSQRQFVQLHASAYHTVAAAMVTVRSLLI